MGSRNKLAALTVGAMLGMLTTYSFGDEQTYKIQIDRPAKIGEHARVERTTVEDLHYVGREGDRTIQDYGWLMGAKIVADEKVLAVDGETAKSIAFTIQGLFSYDGKTDKELLPAGTVLIAEAAEPTPKFTVNGKPISNDLLPPLGFLIRPSTPRDTLSYDKLFGTTVPRSVGETWNLDMKSIAQLVRRSMPGAELSEGNAFGQATLVALEPVDAIPCARIDVDIHAEKLKLAWPTSQPSSASSGGGDISVHYVQHVSLDASIIGGSGSLMMVRHFTWQVHSGSRVENFEETVRSGSETKYTP